MTTICDDQEYLSCSILDHTKVVIYEKNNGMERQQKICLLDADGLNYHEYRGFNKFSKNMLPLATIDKNFTQTLSKETLLKKYNESSHKITESLDEYTTKLIIDQENIILNTICNPNKKLFISGNQSFDQYKEWHKYRTMDNYSTGFIVFINFANKNNIMVHIYGRTEDVIPCHLNEITCFNNLIMRYYPKKVFIGKSKKNNLTASGYTYGKCYNGNSLLLKISEDNEEKNRYVHIGINIFEFTTSENITKYISSLTDNLVHYAYAESENWVYLMDMQKKSPIVYHADRIKKGFVRYCDEIPYIELDNFALIETRNSDSCCTENSSYLNK